MRRRVSRLSETRRAAFLGADHLTITGRRLSGSWRDFKRRDVLAFFCWAPRVRSSLCVRECVQGLTNNALSEPTNLIAHFGRSRPSQNTGRRLSLCVTSQALCDGGDNCEIFAALTSRQSLQQRHPPCGMYALGSGEALGPTGIAWRGGGGRLCGGRNGPSTGVLLRRL